MDFNDDHKDWALSTEFLGYAHRTASQRFCISFESTSYNLGEHWQKSLDQSDTTEYLEWVYNNKGFAKELLNNLKDHLSIKDLRDIVDVFQQELDKELKERKGM